MLATAPRGAASAASPEARSEVVVAASALLSGNCNTGGGVAMVRAGLGERFSSLGAVGDPSATAAASATLGEGGVLPVARPEE